MQPPGRFGALELDGERVREFEEKPRGDGGWTNGGFFVLSPEIGRYLAGRRAPCGSRSRCARSPREGQLASYRHEGFWQAMDTLRDRNQLEQLWSSGTAPWRTWLGRERGHADSRPGFWRERRVLLTGHTGFKGAWLALWLQSLGASVTGFALDVPTRAVAV